MILASTNTADNHETQSKLSQHLCVEYGDEPNDESVKHDVHLGDKQPGQRHCS